MTKWKKKPPGSKKGVSERWAKSIAMWDDDATGQWTMSMEVSWGSESESESGSVWVVLHLGLTHFGRRPAQQTNNQTNKRSKQAEGSDASAQKRCQNHKSHRDASQKPKKPDKRIVLVLVGGGRDWWSEMSVSRGEWRDASKGLTTEHKGRTNARVIIMNEFSVLPLCVLWPSSRIWIFSI